MQASVCGLPLKRFRNFSGPSRDPLLLPEERQMILKFPLATSPAGSWRVFQLATSCSKRTIPHHTEKQSPVGPFHFGGDAPGTAATAYPSSAAVLIQIRRIHPTIISQTGARQ